MTSAELKTMREALGLSAKWVADQVGVRLRTVQYWEAGRMPVPEDVALMLARIDAQYERAVDEALAAYRDQPNPPETVVLLRYRTDADLWHFRPDMKPLPASSHAALLSRLRRALWTAGVPSVIEYMDTGEYLAWLGARQDSEAMRAAWSAGSPTSRTRPS